MKSPARTVETTLPRFGSSTRSGGRGDAAFSSLDGALRLAGDVQRSLLPATLPATRDLSMHAVFLPAGHVSGDVYHIHQPADAEIRLSIADVTGHGLAAAMMATYVIRAFGASSDCTAADSPAERLATLNDDLIRAGCPHAPFVAALTATYDLRLHRVQWARGGVPYPIHIRPGAAPTMLRTAGCILGAFEDVSLQCRYQSLRPGESVIFHTDGLDALLLHEDGARVHDCVSQTAWFASLGERSIGESLADLERRRLEAGDDGWPLDDLTLIALTRRF